MYTCVLCIILYDILYALVCAMYLVLAAIAIASTYCFGFGHDSRFHVNAYSVSIELQLSRYNQVT